MADDDDNVYDLPLHGTSSRKRMERTKGRSRSIAKRPRYKQGERRRWLQDQLDAHVERDIVVQTVRAPQGASAVIHELCVQLAEEAAGLKWERMRHVPGTREAERTSSRRVRALVDLAKLQVVRTQMADGDFDPQDPRVQRVVQLFIDKIQSVVVGVLPEESARNLMEKWKQALEGWEGEV